MRPLLSLLIVCLLFSVIFSPATAQNNPETNFVGTIAAPPFPATVDWLNVEDPLTFEGLRGKFIIMDFWTYGCINCIHMIPVLRDLEERFADELVIIGVHSGKFESEQETDNLQQIVQRYQLEHPVINDEDYEVWRAFGVNAWPTFVVIDPNGNVIGAQAGEVPYEAFEIFLSSAIEFYDNNPEYGTIDRSPLEFVLEGAGDPGTALAFPGKVLVDTEENRLFIADTNHHRIVIADLISYEVLDIIGTGERGYTEGLYEEATFDQPQGMALAGNTLYVADVNNHAIRAIDLTARFVSTVAGTGNMARTLLDFNTVISDPAGADIRSPWDVALGDDNILYIAMAGAHQIWQLNLETNQLQATIGNRFEAQVSTTLADSELAQPSGLHWHDGLLYFADSESSTVRLADIPNNSVSVIAGTTDNSLFDFGDVDGAIGESRLQHALGVTANTDGSLVYIADTYNNKIKVFDTGTGITSTLLGLGLTGGYRDGDASVAQFDEPGGLDYAGGLLYVADTNNHVIRIIDLQTVTVSTLQFSNPEALVINRDEATILGGNTGEDIQIELEPQTLATGNVEMVLNYTIPEGYKINDLTDSTMTISAGESVQLSTDSNPVILTELTTIIPLTVDEGESSISLDIKFFYCEEDSYCLIDAVEFIVPILATSDSDNTSIEINREVTLPEFLANSD